MKQQGSIYYAGPYSQSEFFPVKNVVINAARQEGYSFVDLSYQANPSGWTVNDTIAAITNASLVIAELSSAIPAVLVELGIAEAKGKKIIILADDPGKVPFDFKEHTVLLFSRDSPIKGLTERLKGAIRKSAAANQVDISASWVVERPKVFFSYSQKDRAYLERILVHLRPVEREGIVELWSDTKLQAGDRWKEEIRESINKAQVAVLLISADFLASEFIASDELPPLLSQAQDKGARIIPIIVKPSRFLRDRQLNGYHALNDPRNPLIHMDEGEREILYAKLAEEIELEIGF